ncbi:MAG TPA: sigma-54 dependent transcriptional regulator [Bacteroidia bacterium]|nr:sigma-54 dependent transcriptional regulator [Bacteroidia bacterium]
MKTTTITRIFVVEDDDWYREFLHYVLSLNPDHAVTAFSTGKEVLKNLHLHPDIITIDYHLPDTNGSTLLGLIKEQCPDADTLIISEQHSIDTVVELLKSGAVDYFVKSKDIRDKLLNTVELIKERQGLKQKISRLEKEVEKRYNFQDRLIGSSNNFQSLFPLIEKAAATNITVTISGETGTGKEEIAKAIHYNSSKEKSRFVAINMAAIPIDLAESELFGHEKGAFTGALQSRIGKFEEADGGTLFLDEIAEMELSLQAKLLRVLQEKEVVRVGSNKPIKINTRIIAATHKNLLDEVKKNRFREDLYYRLYGLQINLPPLRERDKDIILLAKYFITQFCKDNQLQVKKISAKAQNKLLAYQFPGNVRELKSITELAVVMSNTDMIEPDDILFSQSNFEAELLSQNLTMEQYEKKIIMHVLSQCNGNVVQAAEKLNIGKSTIYRLLNKERSNSED